MNVTRNNITLTIDELQKLRKQLKDAYIFYFRKNPNSTYEVQTPDDKNSKHYSILRIAMKDVIGVDKISEATLHLFFINDFKLSYKPKTINTIQEFIEKAFANNEGILIQESQSGESVSEALPNNENIDEPMVSINFNEKIDEIYKKFGNDFTSALTAINIEINKLTSNIPEPYFVERAVIRASLKDYDGAVSDFTEAIALNPSFENYRDRGRVYYLNYKDAEAIEDFNQAIILAENEKDRAWLYYLRSIINGHMLKWEVALADINRAVELSKERNYLLHRIVVNFSLKNYIACTEDIDYSLSINENDEKFLLKRGQVYLEMKNYGAALNDFNKVIEINNSSHLAIFGISTVLLLTKKPRKALRFINTYIKSTDEKLAGYALAIRAHIHVKLKKFKSALADFHIATLKHPKVFAEHIGSYADLAMAKFKLNDYSGALIAINKAIENEPDGNMNFYLRAEIHRKLENIDFYHQDYQIAENLKYSSK